MDDKRLLDPHVVCLAGPARSGKTALLRSLLERPGGEYAIVSLRACDSSLFRLIRAIVRALAPLSRGAELSFDAMYDRLGSTLDVEPIVRWLNAHVTQQVTIAVDNVELLASDERTTAFLTRVVSGCTHANWIFSGRTLRALPIDAWLAYGYAALPIALTSDRLWNAREAVDVLPAHERNLIRALCALDVLEAGLVELLAGTAAMAAVQRMAQAHPALFETPPLRLHREVRDLFIAEATGSDARAELRSAGEKLERTRYFNEAMDLYVRAGMLDELQALIEREGLPLGDLAGADALDDALATLPANAPGVVMGLHAVRAARRGHDDVAENYFLRASAEGELSAQVEYAYGCELLRRNRAEAVEIFERLLSRAPAEGPSQVAVRSALAQAYVIADRAPAALEQIRFAMHLLDDAEPQAPLIRNRAAYVYLYAAKEIERAYALAARALADAMERRDYTLAVGALSILYVVACERDRPAEAISALEVLADCGTKLGNAAFVSYALVTILELHVEAHDLDAIDDTMRALEAFDLHYDNLTTCESLLPALAMRMGWQGDFDRAYALLAPGAEHALGAEFRALREAELALYAAAAGRPGDTRMHVERADRAFQGREAGSQQWVRAAIYAALALSLAGHTREGGIRLSTCMQNAMRFPRLAAVREAAWELHRHWSGDRSTELLAFRLDRLRQHRAGGFAALFAALPSERAVAVKVSS